MRKAFIYAFTIWCFNVTAQPTLPYNQGFEVSDNRVDNWKFYTKNGQYIIRYTNAIKRTGKYSLLIDGTNTHRTQDDNDGGFTQIKIPKALTAGKKKARLEAWVKTNGSATHAAVWMNQYGGSNPTDLLK